jgi:hypothetical protein
MSNNPQTDFDGCRRACRLAGAHTLVYGECEQAPEPEPTVSLPRVYTAADGRPSIGFDAYTVPQLARLIEAAVGDPLRAAAAARAIVHRNDEPAAPAVPVSPAVVNEDRRERYVVAIHDAMEPDLSLVDQEPAVQALFARAAEAAEALADTELAADRATVCICGHPEQQHFEDVCQACDCGDYLPPDAAREVIARWRRAAIDARADRAAVLREAADRFAAFDLHVEAAALRRMADEAQQQPEPLRAELKPWQLLGAEPDGPVPQTERVAGGRRLRGDGERPAGGPGRVADEEQGETRQACACGQDGCEYCDVAEEPGS